MSRKKTWSASRWTINLLVVANILAVALMLALGNIDLINPAEHPKISVLSLFFPFTIPVNVAFLLLWLIVKRRYAIIPILGLLLSYGPIRTYIPLNISRQAPDSCITLLSYNVMMFDIAERPDCDNNPIVDYIVGTKADIVCLQETGIAGGIYDNLNGKMARNYAYSDTVMLKKKSDVLTIYSKYPIIDIHRVDYQSQNNLSVACKLLIEGDTVLLINNHFESNRLSPEEKHNFEHLVKGEMKRDSAQKESRTLLSKLVKAAAIRARQADKVALYIDTCKTRSVLVCGDFNDHPNSYTRRVIARRLTDCYRETASGPGFTYQRGGIYVRIDNILCSSDWKPYNCKIDKKITISDHYPIICKLKKASKTLKKR